MKKDVVLALKYGVLVPGVGLHRVLTGSVTATGSGRFELLVKAYHVRGKWRQPQRPFRAWIEDNVVTSRTYVEPKPAQEALAL